jgi:CheY-like chemotaxis protein
MKPLKFDPSNQPSVTLLGFDLEHKGNRLLLSVLTTWLSSWWNFKIQPDDQGPGDITLVNGDDLRIIEEATQRKDTSRPFVCLLAARGNVDSLRIMTSYSSIGGFCRIVFKPGGPSRLLSVMKLCLHFLKSRHHFHQWSAEPQSDEEPFPEFATYEWKSGSSILPRRHSDARSGLSKFQSPRPTLLRSSTVPPLIPEWKSFSSTVGREGSEVNSRDNTKDQVPNSSPSTLHPKDPGPTITFGTNGTLLESSVGTIDKKRSFRVLVVEDNAILRNLLYVFFLHRLILFLKRFSRIKWLQTKVSAYKLISLLAHTYCYTVTGLRISRCRGWSQRRGHFREAWAIRASISPLKLTILSEPPPLSIVLLDMSMPILDGRTQWSGLSHLPTDCASQCWQVSEQASRFDGSSRNVPWCPRQRSQPGFLL